jgi:hypothetical protein
MTHRPTSIRMALVIASCLGLAPTPMLGDDERDSSRLIHDCGVNSLYLLMRLRSADVDLSELRRMLPSTEAHGLSMAEIQAASGRLGVPLRGRRIGPGDVPIDRPVIAWLKSGGSPGHFVVLEPVGVLGKMVMVLDFPRPAQVVEYAYLMKADDWTGRALVPVTTWERSAPWVCSGAGVLLAILGLASPWRRRLATGWRNRGDPRSLTRFLPWGNLGRVRTGDAGVANPRDGREEGD